MRLFPKIENPVTLKRLRRFRNRRRAWWSLWILAGLYLFSLASELICNDRPLYMRFEGRSFFPFLHYYSEDTFLHNGRLTRVDYRALRKTDAFRRTPGARMLFPLVPYSPYESIDPRSMGDVEGVTVAFMPVPRVGQVNLLDDLSVESAASCGWFFGLADGSETGLRVADRWTLPPELADAVARRFRNEAAPALTVTLEPGAAPGRAVASLSAFEPRRVPPRTVRLTFRDAEAQTTAAGVLTLDAALHVSGAAPPEWAALAEGDRSNILTQAHAALSTPVAPVPLAIRGTAYEAHIDKKDVSWPYPPTRGHWMGIDSAGRDVLARILYGLRLSMTFGFLLVSISTLLGVAIGAIQGYFGGRLDITAQRLIEVWSSLPFLYIMILMGSVYGRSFTLLLVCYGIFNWIGISYYMRGEFLRLRHLPFVDSARCMGVSAPRIIVRHVLPNALTPVITFFPFSLVGAIGSLAALDYLGFGLPPPTASWGDLMHQAQQFRWAWWLILFPSAALFVVMLLGVFVGEGVRDANDPRPFSKME